MQVRGDAFALFEQGGALLVRAGLERQPRGEETLDDVVVQVCGNAFALVEQGGALLVRTGLREFESDGGLVREAGCQVQVLGAERGPTAQSDEVEHAVHAVGAAQRHDHDRTGVYHRRPGVRQSRATRPVTSAGAASRS